MKGSIQEIKESKPEFKPCQLVIDIESLEELIDLFNRFNINTTALKGAFQDRGFKDHKYSDRMPVYSAILKHLEKYL